MQMLLPPSSKRNTVSCASLLSSLLSPAPASHSHSHKPPVIASTQSLFNGTSFPSVLQHEHAVLGRKESHESTRLPPPSSSPTGGWAVGTPRVSQMEATFGKNPAKAWQVDLNSEGDYFRGGGRRTRQASRWKEDWEELEMLVRRYVCLWIFFVLII